MRMSSEVVTDCVSQRVRVRYSSLCGGLSFPPPPTLLCGSARVPLHACSACLPRAVCRRPTWQLTGARTLAVASCTRRNGPVDVAGRGELGERRRPYPMAPCDGSRHMMLGVGVGGRRAAPAGAVAARAAAAVRRDWTRRRRDRGVARFYDNLENWSGCRLNCRCACRLQWQSVKSYIPWKGGYLTYFGGP